MVILKEKHPTAGIEGIRWQYNQLGVLFSEIARLFLDRALRQRGFLLEVKNSEEEILSALNQIREALIKIDKIDKKFEFDKPVLNHQYQTELLSCKTYLQTIKNSLNTVWDEGKPVKKETPFAGTTNYRFVLGKILGYMNIANDYSRRINDKAKAFNRANKNLPPLPILPMLTAPEWVKKI
jgi:hypothetical protein